LKRITTIQVGRGPDWMVFTPVGVKCYVSNAGANSVSVLDTVKFKELARIPVGKVPKRIIAAVYFAVTEPSYRPAGSSPRGRPVP